MNRKLSENEYVSYLNDKTSNVVLITPLGGLSFHCTGDCYCSEEEETERRYTNVLSQGLFIILSALTVTVAIKMAKDIFHNSCQQRFSDVCDHSRIISNVNDCEEEPEDVEIISEEEVKKFGKVILDDIKEVQEVRLYSCSGHCVENSLLGGRAMKEVKRIRKENNVKCEGIQIKGQENVFLPTDIIPSVLDANDPSTTKFLDNIAKAHFIQETLHPTCAKVTQVERLREKESIKLEGINSFDHICSGVKGGPSAITDTTVVMSGSFAPNVDCQFLGNRKTGEPAEKPSE